MDWFSVSPPTPSLYLQKPGMPLDHTLWQWIFYFYWASGGCLSQDNHTVPLWEAQNVFGWWNQDALFRLWRQRRRDCKCFSSCDHVISSALLCNASVNDSQLTDCLSIVTHPTDSTVAADSCYSCSSKRQDWIQGFQTSNNLEFFPLVSFFFSLENDIFEPRGRMLHHVSIKFLFLKKDFSGVLTHVWFILKLHEVADITLALCPVMRAAM